MDKQKGEFSFFFIPGNSHKIWLMKIALKTAAKCR